MSLETSMAENEAKVKEMKIVYTKKELIALCDEYKKENRTIGLVPTMGYLHEGHCSLAKRSVADNDITVMSIFVNPVQFGPNEDFDSYPRDLVHDKKAAEDSGVNILFCPEPNEMYGENYSTYVNVEGSVVDCLCGERRPGHFRGVATVVSKLINLVRPENAYFGQKDYQQTCVIRRMVADLDMQTRIVVCPIVREQDGLAKSSRNVYLTEEQRQDAVVLSKSLQMIRSQIVNGADVKTIEANLKAYIEANANCKIDYVELRDADSLEKKRLVVKRTIVALAVYFGNTRLIDNMLVENEC